MAQGPSINDVSSKGEGGGGGQKYQNLLSKKTTKGREGSHKIGKMGRPRLWMAPCYIAASSRLCYCLLLDKVGKMWNLKPSKAFLKKMQLYLESFISPCMDYGRHGEIQGRSLVFFKAHCPCILPCLTQSMVLKRGKQRKSRIKECLRNNGTALFVRWRLN